MIQVVPQHRILLATEPVDFRKGIDSLARVCQSVLQKDPFSGCLFIFINKRRTSIKLLTYDGQGFWLCLKRLSSGKMRWWPVNGHSPARPLAAHQLQILLYNGNPQQTGVPPEWRRILPEV